LRGRIIWLELGRVLAEREGCESPGAAYLLAHELGLPEKLAKTFDLQTLYRLQQHLPHRCIANLHGFWCGHTPLQPLHYFSANENDELPPSSTRYRTARVAM
jgi:hypothetical protein